MEDWEVEEYRDPEGKPRSAGDWILLAFFGLAIFGLLGYEAISESGPGFWFILFFFLSWPLLLILHVVGHLVVARWMGVQLPHLTIGLGPTWRRFYLGKTQVEVKWALIDDAACPPEANGIPRAKCFLVHAAGILTEWLILAGVILVLGLENLFTLTEDLGRIALQASAIAILVRTFFNWIPHYLEYETWTPNDGMAMWQCLRSSEPEE